MKYGSGSGSGPPSPPGSSSGYSLPPPSPPPQPPPGSGAPQRIDTVDIVLCKEAEPLCSKAKKRKFVQISSVIPLVNGFSSIGLSVKRS